MATVSDIELLADPVGFTAGILGHDIWRIPAQILESLAKNRHTAVKSCHASGKTFTAAELSPCSRQNSTWLNPLASYSATNCPASARLRRRRTSTTCVCSSTLSLNHERRREERWVALTLTVLLRVWLSLGLAGGAGWLWFRRFELPGEAPSWVSAGFEIWALGFLALVSFGFYMRVRDIGRE